jgi:hypothetical protein
MLLSAASTSENWGLGFAQYNTNYQVVSSVYTNGYNGNVLALAKRVLFP